MLLYTIQIWPLVISNIHIPHGLMGSSWTTMTGESPPLQPLPCRQRPSRPRRAPPFWLPPVALPRKNAIWPAKIEGLTSENGGLTSENGGLTSENGGLSSQTMEISRFVPAKNHGFHHSKSLVQVLSDRTITIATIMTFTVWGGV